jgi:hypothetical protein
MLTPAERLYFDLNGFILLRDVLTADECERLRDVAAKMKRDSPYPRRDSERQRVLYGPAWYNRLILDLIMDPRLRGRAEDIVGGASRLEENEFLTFAPACEPATATMPSVGELLWHRGLMPDYGSFESDGHYHCLFTKIIVYLSPHEPGAGTWVVPGSHKSRLPVSEFKSLADENLVRQIDARPGDALLFGETLIHSSPHRPRQHERLLFVVAYTAPFMSTWNHETDPPATLAYDVSDEERRFIFGEARYDFRRQVR